MDVNQTSEALTGFSKDELLKRSIPDLHDKLDRHAFELFFDRIMDSEQVTSEACIHKKEDEKSLRSSVPKNSSPAYSL